MPFESPHILADSDSGMIKLVIYLVIGIIWAISAVVKKVSKGMKQTPPTQTAEPTIDLTSRMEVPRVAPSMVPLPPPIPRQKKKVRALKAPAPPVETVRTIAPATD